MSSNPFLAQRELLAGDAVAVLEGRGVVTLTGPDRLSWLDSLTSQSVTGLRPGDSAETLLLDPTGRVEHAMRVVDDGETTWLLVDDPAPLASFLDRMRFLLRVEVADRSADFITVGAFRDLDDAVVTWRDPWIASPGHGYGAAPEAPWDYRELLVSAVPDLPLVAEAALEALRIAAHRPRQASEVDERSIPHELDWLRSAVHLNKGCYRGQETVAKVHNLGHPPRRIVLLHLDGVLPAVGSEVLLPSLPEALEGSAPGSTGVASSASATAEPGGTGVASSASATAATVVGRVTSAAHHYDLGPIALAVVKRSVDPAATLIVRTDEDGDIAAAQEVIVPPSAGAEADVPRLPRLGAVTR